MWTIIIFALGILANAGSFVLENEDEINMNYKTSRALLTPEQEELLMELLAADDALIDAASRGIVDDILAAIAGINQVNIVGPPDNQQPQQVQVPNSPPFSQAANTPALPVGVTNDNQMTAQQQAVFTAMMTSLVGSNSPASAQGPTFASAGSQSQAFGQGPSQSSQFAQEPSQAQSTQFGQSLSQFESEPFAQGLPQAQSPQFGQSQSQTQSVPFAPGTPQSQSPQFGQSQSQTQSAPFAPGSPQSQSPQFGQNQFQTDSAPFAPGPAQSQSPQFAQRPSQSQSTPFAPGPLPNQAPPFASGTGQHPLQQQSPPFASGPAQRPLQQQSPSYASRPSPQRPPQGQAPTYVAGAPQQQRPSFTPVQTLQATAPGAPTVPPTMSQNPNTTAVGGNNNHLFNTIQSVIMGSSSRNVTAIVDQSLRIATPGPIRDLVTGILNVVYCNSVRRLMGRC
ncbi:unnamed protein product [Orchesella dallaii]|uniref:Uncharacterized protein n=1 Tax=Orchesella dallaii TaxID=48710 RepID=A0ABP1RTC9_9HEXA